MPTPVETIRSFYAALACGDAPAALELMSDDIDWVVMEGWPYKPEGRGPQKVAEAVFVPLQQEWTEFKLVPSEYLGDGETVVSIGRFLGVHGLTGKRLNAGYAHIWDVRDGRIARFRQYADTLVVDEARK
ncbi:MAG: nuclear transport factor 2 family protein [Methylocella sp.]